MNDSRQLCNESRSSRPPVKSARVNSAWHTLYIYIYLYSAGNRFLFAVSITTLKGCSNIFLLFADFHYVSPLNEVYKFSLFNIAAVD